MPAETLNVELLLQNLQANILKSHGKNHVWCIFIKWLDGAQSRAWISQVLAPRVTSELQQREMARTWKTRARSAAAEEDALTTCFFLTYTGCTKIGLSKDDIPKDFRFKYGMKSYNVRRDLNDPAVSSWEEGYQQPIDAMVLIANNSEENLTVAFNELFASLNGDSQPIGEIILIEKGKRLFYGDHAIEPFGYRDGINQPQLWHENGQLNFQNARKIALVPEKEAETQYGSFLVFRKLEQDVVGFNQEIIKLANHLQISRELAEAQVMGRFKDGTPLALFSTAGKTGKNLTDTERLHLKKFDLFDPDPSENVNEGYQGDYQNDPNGLKCPLHAHIRKSNPRTDKDINHVPYPMGVGEAIKTRIVRRGIPYDHPGKGVGLYFMSYQNDVYNQFERIQRDWANKLSFPVQSVGLDPLAGQAKDDTTGMQRWNKGWNVPETEVVSFNMNKVVHFKGGEYFYAPSIPFLKQL